MKVITITSPVRRTGKTTLGNYIGLNILNQDPKAILLYIELSDVVSKTPYLHKGLRETYKSLTNVLFKPETLKQNIQRSIHSNRFYYLATNFAEDVLLLHTPTNTLGEILLYASELFDYVILDISCPPTDQLVGSILSRNTKYQIDMNFMILDGDAMTYRAIADYNKVLTDGQCDPIPTTYILNQNALASHLSYVSPYLFKIDKLPPANILHAPKVEYLQQACNEGNLFGMVKTKECQAFYYIMGKAAEIVVKEIVGINLIESGKVEIKKAMKGKSQQDKGEQQRLETLNEESSDEDALVNTTENTPKKKGLFTKLFSGKQCKNNGARGVKGNIKTKRNLKQDTQESVGLSSESVYQDDQIEQSQQGLQNQTGRKGNSKSNRKRNRKSVQVEQDTQVDFRTQSHNDFFGNLSADFDKNFDDYDSDADSTINHEFEENPKENLTHIPQFSTAPKEQTSSQERTEPKDITDPQTIPLTETNTTDKEIVQPVKSKPLQRKIKKPSLRTINTKSDTEVTVVNTMEANVQDLSNVAQPVQTSAFNLKDKLAPTTVPIQEVPNTTDTSKILEPKADTETEQIKETREANGVAQGMTSTLNKQAPFSKQTKIKLHPKQTLQNQGSAAPTVDNTQPEKDPNMDIIDYGDLDSLIDDIAEKGGF